MQLRSYNCMSATQIMLISLSFELFSLSLCKVLDIFPSLIRQHSPETPLYQIAHNH